MSGNRKFFIKFIGLFLLILLLGIIYDFSSKSHLSFQNKNARIVAFVTRTPTITPTPTVNPTPTPEPLIGFCLHIPVIYYHHIQPEEEAKRNGQVNLTVDSQFFDSQMKYLTDNGYKTISAEEMVNALIDHRDPGKAAVVTIDDGYEDNYTYAYQTAKKYNIILNLFIPTGLIENSGYLTWGQLKEMTASGLVTAYDHTWSHYSSGGSNEEKIDWEIVTAKKQLEDNLGKPVKIFAYPFGSVGPWVTDVLQKEGFTGAFTTSPGFWQCDSRIYYLRRMRIGNAPLSSYGL